jgi:hypothetical protein
VAWILRLVKIGTEGEVRSLDIMEIERPEDIADIADLGLTLSLKVGEALGECATTRPEVAASAVVVVLDSTFIRSCEQEQRHLEVRVGNVETATGGRQVFGSVVRARTDMKVLINRNLDAVGRTGETELTAFTDGCSGLQNILAVEEVERLHWRLWNDKATNARVSIDRIGAVMHHFKGEADARKSITSSRKLWTALHTLDGCLTGQSDRLVNHADRHWAGLRVGTAITEGAANFLVNRRMNKSQQMR